MLVQISLQKFGAGTSDSFEFSQALCRKKFKHAVFLSSGNEIRDRWSENEYRRIFWLKTYGSTSASFLFWTLAVGRWLKLAYLLLKLKPRAVYATNFHPWLFFVSLLKRLGGFSFFYAIHENPFKPKETGSRVQLFLEKFVARQSDTVIAHSDFVSKEIGGYLEGKPIKVLPLGAYREYCQNFKKQAAPTRQLRVLFVGRLEKYKGVEVLVDAVDLLQKEGLDISLTIAGRGTLVPATLGKIETARVELMNRWIDAGEICSLLSAADLLALPYLEASQSGVVSLGLAYGLPMVASRVGGLPEQVIDGQNGFLAEPGDCRSLAEKIRVLYEKRELLASFSAESKRLGEEVFSWDNVATGVIGLSGENQPTRQMDK